MSLPTIKFNTTDISNHKALAKAKVTDLEDYRDTNFGNDHTQWQYRYLEELINNIEDIATGDIENYKLTLDAINTFNPIKNCTCPSNTTTKGSCPYCKERKFSAEVQKILGYNHATLKEYFLYNANKACYICNAQYTVIAQKDTICKIDYKGINTLKRFYRKAKPLYVVQSEHKAKFQLDHYYPKSLYPAFAISLHNLFPVCVNCNQIKYKAKLDISKLYTHAKFELTENTIYRFYKRQNSKDLTLNVNDLGTGGLVEKFDLKGIYDNHIDYVEELMVRKIKYNENYKKALIHKHKDITPTFTSIDDRLLVGTYSKQEGFFKRPLSKLLHDINDQLEDYVKK